jgi:galactokinase/mevalonate kinase-like predicted kinase
MITSKCPLRISLAGGSSDLEEYIQNEKYGSVISFPCNLYAYNTIFIDKNGYNRRSGEYIIEYTNRKNKINRQNRKRGCKIRIRTF